MSTIDIVIPHVDGSAPGYEQLCRHYAGEFIPCQLRDLGELRFVLRSIATFADWARIVLVVQTPAHVPDWLNRREVRIVLHEEFIPPAHLPTFHWATIVAHLHRIPSLSERYILWEDDVVLCAPRREPEFFEPDELMASGWATAPVISGLSRWLGAYQRNLEETRRSLQRVLRRRAACHLYPHAPLAVTRASWTAFFDRFLADPAFHDTVTRRSRGDEATLKTIDPLVLYANWVDAGLRGMPEHARAASLAFALARATRRAMQRRLIGTAHVPPLCGKYAVVNDTARMRRNMSRLLEERAVFSNVNDEAYDTWSGGSEILNPVSLELLHQTLSTLFPMPSRFELKAHHPSQREASPA